MVALSGTHKLANALLSAGGKDDLAKVQAELDKENPHKPFSFALPGVKLRVTTAVKQVRREDNNVVAVLPPSVPTDNPEYVMIGAHYDHIGYNDGSLQPKGGDPGLIHNGADDNTSGTVVLLELAAWMAEARKHNPEKFKRGVIFCWWTGEELGLGFCSIRQESTNSVQTGRGLHQSGHGGAHEKQPANHAGHGFI